MSKPQRIGNRLGAIKLSGLLAILVIPLFLGTKLIQAGSDGAQIFQEQCAGCHTIGAGDLLGPDLLGITQQRDRQWLADFISDPGKMLSAGDPIAVALRQKYGDQTMPSLGLSPEQVATLIAYLDSQAGGTEANSSPPVSLLPGEADKGKSLFMGEDHFENDGPPCMGCHNIGSHGLLGGGVLGPDLSAAGSTYTEASLAAALANIPWPTMKPIYAKHPLTDEEQANLRAFLIASAGQHETNREIWVFAISLAGLAGAVLVIGLLYRRRLKAVRRSLVDRNRPGA